MEFEKIKEGKILTKEDLVEKLPAMDFEIIDHTEQEIEGEYEDYSVIIDENNKVTVGDKFVGSKPVGEVEEMAML